MQHFTSKATAKRCLCFMYTFARGCLTDVICKGILCSTRRAHHLHISNFCSGVPRKTTPTGKGNCVVARGE